MYGSYMTLGEAIGHLYRWRIYGGDNFHAALFHLFQKADDQNLGHLSIGFPAESLAWKMWTAAADEWEFFRQHGYDRAKP